MLCVTFLSDIFFNMFKTLVKSNSTLEEYSKRMSLINLKIYQIPIKGFAKLSKNTCISNCCYGLEIEEMKTFQITINFKGFVELSKKTFDSYCCYGMLIENKTILDSYKEIFQTE